MVAKPEWLGSYLNVLGGGSYVARTGFPLCDPSLGLFDGVAGIVFGVVLVVGAVVGDAPDDFFRIVTSRECALCVGPIPLGLGERFSLAN